MHNENITCDNDILNLIKCPKIFKSAPKKPVISNRNISYKFSVYGQENDFEFPIVITVSERMRRDFSIGLRYKNMLLLRCNGFHGTTKAGFYSAEHHAYPHWHMLSITDIENERSLKPSNIKDLTGKYFNLQTAIAFFFDECAIIDYEEFFPVNQLSLYDAEQYL